MAFVRKVIFAMEPSLRIQNSLRPTSRSSEISHLHADPVFGPYAIKFADFAVQNVAIYVASMFRPNPSITPVSEAALRKLRMNPMDPHKLNRSRGPEPAQP